MFEAHFFITWLIIGFIAGALASRAVQGGGMGCIMSIAVGLAGSVIGGALLHAVRPDEKQIGLLETIVVSFIGATLFLAVLQLLTGNWRKGSRPPRRW